MNKITLILILSYGSLVCAQRTVDTVGLSPPIISQLIFLKVKKENSAVIYRNGKMGAIDQRGVSLYYQKGNHEFSSYQLFITNRAEFKKLIEDDAEALEFFEEAMLCLGQARKSEIIRGISNIATFIYAVSGLMIYVQSEGSGMPPISKILFAGAGIAYINSTVFFFKSKRQYKQFINSIYECAYVYNENIINNSE